MSILVHPDKNQDDKDRADKAFEGKTFVIVQKICYCSKCGMETIHITRLLTNQL